MGETKKDWSLVGEIFEKQKEKSRAEMSPEQLAEELRAEEFVKKMRGEVSVKAEASKKEEEKNPEKIEAAKKELDDIYETEQPEETPRKSTEDLIAEARKQDEQLHLENLAREKAKIEKYAEKLKKDREEHFGKK